RLPRKNFRQDPPDEPRLQFVRRIRDSGTAPRCHCPRQDRRARRQIRRRTRPRPIPETRTDPFLMSTVSSAIAPDVDLTIELEHNHLYNADLAPVPGDRRKWKVGSFAALWISISA